MYLSEIYFVQNLSIEFCVRMLQLKQIYRWYLPLTRRYEQDSGKSIDHQMLVGIIINGIQDTSARDHVIRD